MPPQSPSLARPRLLRGATVGVVGTGLIGGSIVRALRRHRPAIRTLATDRDASLAPAVGRHATWCNSLAELVAQSDVVVLAVPVPEILRLMPELARLSPARASRRRLLVCDTGTLKAPVVSAAYRFRGAFDFAGLHPMAGGEHNGWPASHAGLLRAKPVIVCARDAKVRRQARELVRLVGGIPSDMDARAHDRTVAVFIGLPHVLAFAAAGLAGLPPAHALRGRSWQSLTRVS
ncbi:MAG: prephenate dehydrogenase/arogenate dehydrogenase family protein, partial [Acidobacteria bacterium]|nr:prephenate dehydrogenase/arogenate dehydrogenase family protein [Acidobacteriota bacterium]